MTGTFPLGGIPPLSVWEGETLNFKVTSKLGAGVTYTVRATPAPSGQMSIDENSGIFTYAPSPKDREEIAVAIRASNGGKENANRRHYAASTFRLRENANPANSIAVKVATILILR